MSQPPVSGDGEGAEPGRGPELPGGSPGAADAPGRDPRLAGFAAGGQWDASPPGPGLAAAAAAASGPDWRCPGATDDELTGLLSRWAAVESWATASKLGVVRELIRRRAIPVPGTGRPGGLPELWEDSVDHEVAEALGISPQAAGKLVNLAWVLEARLPGIGARLADGTLNFIKTKLIVDELIVLDDEHIAAAEQMILPELPGKTPGQLAKLAALAVATVDPEGTRKRREYAEREDARVRFWREHTGATALAAYGLPADAALSANANINQRAEEYKRAKIYPDARMDQLRALAFTDILNGISAADRIARAQAEAQAQAGAGAGHGPGEAAGAGTPSAGTGGDPGEDGPAHGDDSPAGSHASRDDGDGEPGPADGDSDDDPGGSDGGPGGDGGPGDGPDSGSHGGGAGAAPGTGDVGPVLPARSNLTLPLATLLGLAERPGEAHGLGALDPALVRDLAAAAARSPHGEWCVTVTSPEGYAIGHGCAKPARKKRGESPPAGSRDGPWGFTRSDAPGPPDGYGTWALTLPDGRELTVKIGPVPVTECDHRYESHSYQPSETLRHLVQIRDGQCTFPCCSRHARESDFEHAIPYDQGGRTCACNAGARSRRCHKVKQSKGWSVTQPRPGWHQWRAPSGRIYTQGPAKYPA
jgi:Domain of unknown function (DUF222)